MPIQYKEIDIREFLKTYYPDINLDNNYVKTVLKYFDDDVLYVTIAKKTHCFHAGKNISLENCYDALARLSDIGLCSVKEFVDTAFAWEKILKRHNRL